MEARSGHNAISFLEGYEEGKKAGIKEVVEWIDGITNNPICKYKNNYLCLYKKEWQAKLKEWGIDGS